MAISANDEEEEKRRRSPCADISQKIFCYCDEPKNVS